MIRAFLERRRAKRAIKKLLDPKVLANADAAAVFNHGRIDFVLAFVRGENAAQISERIGRVADLSMKYGATVHDLIGGLVVAAFGTLPACSEQSGDRLMLVNALRAELGGDIKLVHGAADGEYGTFGSSTRMAYSFTVPQFDTILGSLSRLQFGEMEEVRE